MKRLVPATGLECESLSGQILNRIVKHTIKATLRVTSWTGDTSALVNMPKINHGPVTRRAFTLVELLVVIAIIGILTGMVLSGVAAAKESGKRAQCLNNLRQLMLSALMYGDDNEGRLPPRTSPRWPTTLRPGYVTLKLLVCPDDPTPQSSLTSTNEADAAPRSYLINGWNDYWQSQLNGTNQNAFLAWKYPGEMPVEAIPYPTETILFGEKASEWRSFHMDFLQVSAFSGIEGDDLNATEDARHSNNSHGTSGGSMVAYVAGNVGFLKYGRARSPMNLWAVTDEWRTNSATFVSP